MSVYFLRTLCRSFSNSAYQILRIFNIYPSPKRTSLSPYLLEPFAVIGETLRGQRLASGLPWWSIFQATINHIITGIVQDWLARSGQLPLSILIYSNSYKKLVSPLADIIKQYSNRWSDLALHIPDSYYQCFHATDNHAPMFKSIQFHCSFNSRADMNFQLTCPRLERASFTYYPINGTNIHWDNLTHFTLRFMSIINFFLILRKTPRLVFCKLSSLCSLDRGRTVGAPVLTSLRCLQLMITSSVDDSLNSLIAPHLEEFSLPNYFKPSMEVITSFLRRSVCSLRSFSVILSIFSSYLKSFMDLLQSMPSLNTLSIISTTKTTYHSHNTIPEDYDICNILRLVAKVLSSQSTSLQQGFLPNLKILEYTGKLHLRPGNYDDLYFLPPADNALHGPLHLLKFNIHPATRIPKHMISYFSSLMELGVTVNGLSKSKDILQSSIDYYRSNDDSLSQDWIDNLDSSLFP